KNRSLPFAMSWLKRSGGGGALLQPDSPTRAHRTKAVENNSRERIRPPLSSGVSYSFDSTSIRRPSTHAGQVLLAARQGGVTSWTVLLGLADARAELRTITLCSLVVWKRGFVRLRKAPLQRQEDCDGRCP